MESHRHNIFIIIIFFIFGVSFQVDKYIDESIFDGVENIWGKCLTSGCKEDRKSEIANDVRILESRLSRLNTKHNYYI